MSFDDFLNMFSAFSERAPKEQKAFYAFKIYDYDGDGFHGFQDLSKTLKALTKDSLDEKERKLICERVMREANME